MRKLWNITNHTQPYPPTDTDVRILRPSAQNRSKILAQYIHSAQLPIRIGGSALNLAQNFAVISLLTVSAVSLISTLENINRIIQNDENYNLMKVYKSYEKFVIRAYKFRAVKLRLRIAVNNITERFL